MFPPPINPIVFIFFPFPVINHEVHEELLCLFFKSSIAYSYLIITKHSDYASIYLLRNRAACAAALLLPRQQVKLFGA